MLFAGLRCPAAFVTAAAPAWVTPTVPPGRPKSMFASKLASISPYNGPGRTARINELSVVPRLRFPRTCVRTEVSP